MKRFICGVIGHKLNVSSLQVIDKNIKIASDATLKLTKQIFCERCLSSFTISDLTLYNENYFDNSAQNVKIGKYLEFDNHGFVIVARNSALTIDSDSKAVIIETTKDGKLIWINNWSYLGNKKFNRFLARMEYYSIEYNKKVVSDRVLESITIEDQNTTGQLSLSGGNND